MKPIKIIDELRAVCPQVAIGSLEYDLSYQPCSDQIWNLIELEAESIKADLSLEELAGKLPIRDGRKVYRALGKDPTRYRISSEALIRRILKGKGIYQVNNIVDFNNLISLKTFFSAGSFDLMRIHGEIRFGIGRKEELYFGIGREQLNIEGLPVLIDDMGPFGSPTSDSERTRIQEGTRQVLTVIPSFSGAEVLEPVIDDAIRILGEILNARNITTGIYC